ncbi:hypothetical protein OUZ56_018617 [Daphnia magna]|uniref:Uncharacterized protein n=1 Tax=Daphnia magna TaxID=35525 RepID=A0ABQ9ZAH6_9CRUS|nr:hypothetical protein OUZ56_018617 [Daphnia magna]
MRINVVDCLATLFDFDSTALPTELSKDGILTRATYVHKNLFVKPYALLLTDYALRNCIWMAFGYV